MQIVKDFLIKFTKKSHLADFFTEQTFDFVCHRFLCVLVEVDTNHIGGLVDGLAETRLCVLCVGLDCVCVH